MFKENDFLKLENNQSKFEGDQNNKQVNNFLMSPEMLDRRYRFPSHKTPETVAFMEELDREIEKITRGKKISIFDKLKKSRQENKKEISSEEILKEDINEIISNYPEDTKLIDLPPELLGKILSPMNKEIRETLYVQRNTLTLSIALKTYFRWTKDVVLAFHVSDKELKDGKLKAGAGENSVYFSTDINRLFNLKSAKYIYAFRLSNQEVSRYRYGALDCFGKMQLKDNQGVEIEDYIKIFDPNDPSYRQKTLNEVGANFDTSYRAADDWAADFMEKK